VQYSFVDFLAGFKDFSKRQCTEPLVLKSGFSQILCTIACDVQAQAAAGWKNFEPARAI